MHMIMIKFIRKRNLFINVFAILFIIAILILWSFNVFDKSIYKSTANILFFTDLHYSNKDSIGLYNNLDSIKQFADTQSVDLIVSGGDINISHTNHDISIENLKYVTNAFNGLKIPILYTLGNHDRFIKHVPEEDISKSEYFDIVLKNLDSDVIFNNIDIEGGYYYKDLEKSQIRVCILNSFSEGNYEYIYNIAQLKFVAEQVLNFKDKEHPEDWQVIFFAHTSFSTQFHAEEVKNSDVLLNILNSFKNRTKFEYSGIIADYTTNIGGTIIAIITGHHHIDYDFIKDDILIIGTDSSNYTVSRTSENYLTSINGYELNPCFDIFSIDTKNRTITAKRVGNGVDRNWHY